VVGGRLGVADGGEEEIDVALAVFDPEAEIWRPRLEAGRYGGGVVIARRAADDLGVDVGDPVTLRHPRLAGTGFEIVESELSVSGIHDNPVRAYAYLADAEAAALGLGGVSNTLTVLPAAGGAPGAIEAALFGKPRIGSVRPADASVEALREALESTSSVFAIIAVITLAMAVLVAFTSTSVSIDEHRREYATMFAFGLPPRTGLRVSVTESVVTGVLGTIVGFGLGLAVASWMISSVIADTAPDLAMQLELTTASLVITVLVGVAAVALAPLLTYRRMRRMDIPSTLRVME
jgi:putative ABC transport system permease protein